MGAGVSVEVAVGAGRVSRRGVGMGVVDAVAGGGVDGASTRPMGAFPDPHAVSSIPITIQPVTNALPLICMVSFLPGR